MSAAELVDALERLKKEEPPLGPAERENYFMSQVATGEQLAAQGNLLMSIHYNTL